MKSKNEIMVENISELETSKLEAEQRLLGFEDHSDGEIVSDSSEFPYNPDEIRIDTKTFPIFQIKSMIERNRLELKPEFQ